MALVILGKTECKICGQPVNKGDFYGFPPFVGNTLDPLIIFNDSVFHKECAKNNQLAQNALKRYELIESLNTIPPRCSLTEELITNPDDYLNLGFFTEDESHALHPYNCMVFHRKNFKTWEKNRWIISEIEKLDQSGQWGGDGLKRLLRQLKNVVDS